MRLKNKVALVTGGAAGIGEAIVRRFAAEGAVVYLGDVDAKGGEAVAKAAGATFVKLDVSSRADWDHVAALVTERHRQLDVLVNNAGIVSHLAIDAVDEATWNRIMAINVTGTMLGCQAAIRMVKGVADARPVSVVNVSSTTGLMGLPNDAAYSTSKHAILGLTRSSAGYCARSKIPVRFNTLHPGATLTSILQGYIDQDPRMRDVFNSMSPLGRMASTDEQAAVALFLASDESSYCTGAAFVADGGITSMHPVVG